MSDRKVADLAQEHGISEAGAVHLEEQVWLLC